MTRFALTLVLCTVTAHSAYAQTAPGTTPAPPAQATAQPPASPYKFSGLVFGDYYAFGSSHLDAWEGQHGVWLRRAYFTYDHTFSPTLTSRLRLEMNSNGKLAGGALTPYVKDAYLRWTFTGRQALTIGMQPTLTFDYVESVWGLRHIEKTPLDLYRIDSSRETGVTLSGPLNEKRSFNYAVQYGNDSGSNAETDKFKGYRATLRYDTNPGFGIEAFVARFNRDRDADRTTAQVVGAYRTARGRAGLLYAFQRRDAAEGSTAPATDMRVVSGFGVFEVKPKRTTAFMRVDRFADPCVDCAGIDYLPIDPTSPFTLAIAGVDQAIHPSVRISPNVEWVEYDRAIKRDVVMRLTFYWIF